MEVSLSNLIGYQYPNILNYTAEQFQRAGNHLFTAVRYSVDKVSPLGCSILRSCDKIKSRPNQFGKLLSITADTATLLKINEIGRSYSALIKTCGAVGALYGALQIGDTIKYLGVNLCHKYRTGSFKEKNITKGVNAISFGVADFCDSLLWANDKNLVDLGKYAIKSIGGVSTRGLSLVNVMSGGALIGFGLMSYTTASKLYANYNEPCMTEDQKRSKICSLVWTASEIALIAIPLVGFAPATSWMIAGNIFAKSAGIAAFLYN